MTSRSAAVAKGNRTRRYRKEFLKKYPKTGVEVSKLIGKYKNNVKTMAAKETAWLDSVKETVYRLRTIKGNFGRLNLYRNMIIKCNYGVLSPLPSKS